MTKVLLVLAGVAVLLAVGALIGSGLHTRSIDRRYRQVAQLVRELNEREEAMARSGHTRAICEGCPLELPGLTLSPVNENGAGQAVKVPSPRRYDAQHDSGLAPHASATDPRRGDAGTIGAR